jgi:hypothetical protein
MLVRAPGIVRFLSVSRLDTWRVTRTRKPTSTRRRDPAGQGGVRPSAPAPHSPTPLPPAELARCVRELDTLIGELADLTDSGSSWGMRVLRRNIELALLGPRTLESPQNQLDFIEELAEAVWDGADAGFRFAARRAGTAEETRRRDDRRRIVVERLDDITHRLCASAEAWRECGEPGESGPSPDLGESPG